KPIAPPGEGPGSSSSSPGRGTAAIPAPNGSPSGRGGCVASGSPWPGNGTAPAGTRGPPVLACVPGNGTAPFAPGGFAPAGRPGGAPVPGSGTFCPAALPSPGFGRCTVNGVLHFGHLMDRPAGGTRPSSSSYAAGQLGHWIRIAVRRSSGVLEALLEREIGRVGVRVAAARFQKPRRQ